MLLRSLVSTPGSEVAAAVLPLPSAVIRCGGGSSGGWATAAREEGAVSSMRGEGSWGISSGL